MQAHRRDAVFFLFLKSATLGADFLEARIVVVRWRHYHLWRESAGESAQLIWQSCKHAGCRRRVHIGSPTRACHGGRVVGFFTWGKRGSLFVIITYQLDFKGIQLGLICILLTNTIRTTTDSFPSLLHTCSYMTRAPGRSHRNSKVTIDLKKTVYDDLIIHVSPKV